MNINLIDLFVEDLALRGFSQGSRRTYKETLKEFAKYHPNLIEVNKPELKSYLAKLRLERKVSTSTLRLHFSILSSFYDFLVDEEYIPRNPVTSFRKRNLHQYKNHPAQRQIISIDQAARLVRSIVNSRDRAIILLLLKTGVRRHELSDLDLSDVDMDHMSIDLKPTPKRTNRTVFFDHEAKDALVWYLRSRSRPNPALFIGRGGRRLSGEMISKIVMTHASRIGLHDLTSKKSEERFTAHCCRHWFTTQLRKAGMPREFIQELRGDVRKEAIDIYDHIDKDELKKSYLVYIPQLGL